MCSVCVCIAVNLRPKLTVRFRVNIFMLIFKFILIIILENMKIMVYICFFLHSSKWLIVSIPSIIESKYFREKLTIL